MFKKSCFKKDINQTFF